LLIPAAPAITSRHPALRLELIANPKNLSLTRREADIALRLARPTETAGNRVIARRITTLSYGVYASRENERDFEDLR
jgi:DNA-binding transcriptional LysR family regulator